MKGDPILMSSCLEGHGDNQQTPQCLLDGTLDVVWVVYEGLSLALISGKLWGKKWVIRRTPVPIWGLRSRLVYCKRAFVRQSRS